MTTKVKMWDRWEARAAIEVDADGMVSGLFVWDEDELDFRNVYVQELKNPLVDLVDDKDAYLTLLQGQVASMRKQLDAIYRAVGFDAS